jgi:protein phosphatase
MQIRSDIELANLSDVGCEREANEDYYCYVEPDRDEEFAAKGRLIVVADGMGGHIGGQVASGLAVDALREAFLTDGADPLNILIDGFSRAQASILARAEAEPDLKGMGTTCTAAIVHRGGLIYGHIGDSRLYLVRQGQLTQITDDHSLVNQLVKSGAITAEQAEVHEKKNVLTAALGMQSSAAAADFSEVPLALAAQDILVLCSDGLHGLVSPDEVAQAVSVQSAYDACRTLVEWAKQRGGHDNITVQVAKIISVPQ